MTMKGDNMTEAPEPGSYTRPGDTPPAAENPMRPDVWVRCNDLRLGYFADETTSTHARKVRVQTGERVSYWLADVIDTNGRELDSFAVLLWLTRMQHGEPDLDLASITVAFGDDYGIETGIEGDGVEASTPE